MRNFFIVVVFGAFLMGCKPSEKRSMAPLRAAENPAKGPGGAIECTGTLHPVTVFRPKLKASELLQQMHVAEGQEVKAGALLATLRDPGLKSELLNVLERRVALRRELAETETSRKKKEIAQLRLTELERQLAGKSSLENKVAGFNVEVHSRQLLDDKAAVVAEISLLDQQIATGQKLRGELEHLLKALDERALELEAAISELNVRAPFEGALVRTHRANDAPGLPYLELHGRSKYEAHGVLWQTHLEFVRKGCLVSLSPDSDRGRVWKGVVESVGLTPIAEATESFPRFRVIVALEEREQMELLREGMTVSMRIERAKRP